MPLDQRDWIMLGIGLGIGFLVFSAMGKTFIRSAYKMTSAEVKKLERKAREREKEEEEKIKALA